MRFLALVALRCLCGTAPVTRRSGKSMIVVRRLAAHNRLRDAVYHWARVAVQRDPTSRAKYAPPSVPAATAMPVPCDPSPTGSSPSPVPCSKTRPPSIPNTQGNAMPRSRYPGHRAAGTIAAKLHLQMVGSPPPRVGVEKQWTRATRSHGHYRWRLRRGRARSWELRLSVRAVTASRHPPERRAETRPREPCCWAKKC